MRRRRPCRSRPAAPDRSRARSSGPAAPPASMPYGAVTGSRWTIGSIGSSSVTPASSARRTSPSVTVPISRRSGSATSAISIAPASMHSIASRTVAPGRDEDLLQTSGIHRRVTLEPRTGERLSAAAGEGGPRARRLPPCRAERCGSRPHRRPRPPAPDSQALENARLRCRRAHPPPTRTPPPSAHRVARWTWSAI